MANRILALVLVVVSVYLLVVTGSFIYFDVIHEAIDGLYVSLYLGLFTLTFILVSLASDLNFHKYIVYPAWLLLLLGGRTFYLIFMYIDDTPLSSDVKYGFNYYIYHTEFKEAEFALFKTPYAISYLITVFIVVVISVFLLYKDKTTQIKSVNKEEIVK